MVLNIGGAGNYVPGGQYDPAVMAAEAEKNKAKCCGCVDWNLAIFLMMILSLVSAWRVYSAVEGYYFWCRWLGYGCKG